MGLYVKALTRELSAKDGVTAATVKALDKIKIRLKEAGLDGELFCVPFLAGYHVFFILSDGSGPRLEVKAGFAYMAEDGKIRIEPNLNKDNLVQSFFIGAFCMAFQQAANE